MKYFYYHFSNLYTKQDCAEIIKYCKANKSGFWHDHPANTTKNLTAYCFDIFKDVDYFDRVWHCVKYTNESIFGYDLFDYKLSHGNINFYEANNNEYKMHRDQSLPGEQQDIKLTAILNVSQDEYSGGDFNIFEGKETKIEEIDTTGTLLIFPSIFYHAVKPVKKGNRTTVSFWFKGPKLK